MTGDWYGSRGGVRRCLPPKTKATPAPRATVHAAPSTNHPAARIIQTKGPGEYAPIAMT
jgi:hypothetical protein